MKRSLDRWKKSDPQAMAENQSLAAIRFAFEDAKADILELAEENARLRKRLRAAALPTLGGSGNESE